MTNRTSATSIGSWTYEEYEPGEDRAKIVAESLHLRDVLSFEIPRSSMWFGKLAGLINRLYFLRLGEFRFGSVEPVLDPAEEAKLLAIPKDAGTLLVGPHPGPRDPHLMFYLFAKTGHIPAFFLMAAESYYAGFALRRWCLNRLGVVPVARGRRNPEAIRIMTEELSRGAWAGIFPEGDVYFSRQVMPMEYGALRIGVEAAIAATRESPGRPRPILVAPFAFAYFFVDPEKTKRRLRKALELLEERPEVYGRRSSGDVLDRLRGIAGKLLEYKASQYGVTQERWQDPDPFERGRKLQTAVLEDLETRYFGEHQDGFARRRAVKLRMHIFERLTKTDLAAAERDRLHQDVQKTRDVVLTVPFTRDYVAKYSDLEMWVEYLRRFQTVLGIKHYNFGPQRVIYKVLAPIDMHELARIFQAIGNVEKQRSFLFEQTELLRDVIQAGVDDVRRYFGSETTSVSTGVN